MLARISTALLAFILASMVPLQGQDQSASVGSAGPIATDRPAITDSSVVVPVGSLQVENGFLETSSQRQSMLDGSESLVRVGIAKKTELRFTVPDYFYNLSAGGGPSSGFGDFAVGVKQQLGPTLGKFDVSVVGFLSFPTGANTVSSGGYDPGLQVPWSRALSGNWTAAGMFSVYWPTQGRTRNPEPASSSCAPGRTLNYTGQKSACRKSHQKVPRDALVSTNGVVPSWSAERKQSTSAVTTTVNSLLSNVPPFLPFFCIGPKLRFIRSTPIASESMSQNDLKCFANTGVNSLQTPCSSTRIRDIHKPSGACGCPPSCASRLKSQLASQRLFSPSLILLVWNKQRDIAAAKR
jgi:hypothetical protein